MATVPGEETDDVAAAVEAKGGLDTLYLGVGVAVVIAALTAFLRYGRDS